MKPAKQGDKRRHEALTGAQLAQACSVQSTKQQQVKRPTNSRKIFQAKHVDLALVHAQLADVGLW
jgi:hypothetical protein